MINIRKIFIVKTLFVMIFLSTVLKTAVGQDFTAPPDTAKLITIDSVGTVTNDSTQNAVNDSVETITSDSIKNISDDSIKIIPKKDSVKVKHYLKSFFMVQGTYVRHLGNFANTWSHTTGIYAGVGLYLPNNYILHFKTGLLTIHNRNNINFPANSETTVVPILIGGKYVFDFSAVQPYLSFNGGFNVIFEKADLEGQKHERTLLKCYWQAGAGSYIRIFNKLKLELSVNMNSHFYVDEAMMTGFEYIIGFVY